MYGYLHKTCTQEGWGACGATDYREILQER